MFFTPSDCEEKILFTIFSIFFFVTDFLYFFRLLYILFDVCFSGKIAENPPLIRMTVEHKKNVVKKTNL